MVGKSSCYLVKISSNGLLQVITFLCIKQLFVYETLLCRCCSQWEKAAQSPADYSLCNQDRPHFAERVLWIHLLYNVEDTLSAVTAGTQCNSGALDEDDLLMTLSMKGFWKTKIWSCLLRNSSLRTLLYCFTFFHIFPHPFAPFLPNSHFSLKNAVSAQLACFHSLPLSFPSWDIATALQYLWLHHL